MIEPEILRGWKEIEAFLGMKRPNILSCGYPIRHEARKGRRGVSVFAVKKELLAHAQGRPLVGA